MADFSVKGVVDIIRGPGRGAEDAAESLGRLDSAASGVARKLTAVFSAAALGALIRGSVIEFARVERGLGAVNRVLDQLGLSADKNMPRVKAYLEALESGGAPLMTETVPAFEKFIGITKDVDAALEAVSFAADISEAKMIDMGTATSLVVAMLQGRATSAANALGLSLVKLNGEQSTNVDLLDEAIKKYRGANEALEDTRNRLDRVASGWARLKRSIGETIGGMVDSLEPAQRATSAFFASLFAVATTALVGVAKTIRQTFDIRQLIANPEAYFADIFVSVAEAKAKIINTTAAGASAVRAAWKEQAKGTIADESERLDALENLRKIARLKTLEEERKAAEERAAEAEKAARKSAQQEAEAKLDEFAKLYAETDRLFRESVDRETQAIEKLRGMRHATRTAEAEAELAEREARLAALGEMDVRRAAEEIALIRATEVAELESIDREAQAEILAAGTTSEMIAEIEAEAAAKKRRVNADTNRALDQMDKMRRRAAQDNALAIANSVVGALRAAFGESKAVAIAETVVNTAAAIMRAFREAPYPVAVGISALLAVAGAKQIAKIQSAQPGGGGGVSDVGGGAGSAAAQPDEQRPSLILPDIGPALPQGAASGGGVVIQGNVYGGHAGMRQLRRELERADSQDRSSRLGGR